MEPQSPTIIIQSVFSILELKSTQPSINQVEEATTVEMAAEFKQDQGLEIQMVVVKARVAV